MRIERLSIPDVLSISPTIHRDERGQFAETWNSARYAAEGLDLAFVQDNQSLSRAGTVRGLHYQIERAQGKLVWAAEGSIFDVAVDLRRSSPTFGRWVGATLTGDDLTQLYIPPGFAHGFLTLSARAIVVYKCTDHYAPQHERTLLWNDPDLGIEWPIAPGAEPVLSEKDRHGRRLIEAEVYR